MDTENRLCRLIARPHGEIQRSDFAFDSEPVAEPDAGQVRVAVEYLSLDPAMRGWMNDAPSYMPPVRLGDVMRAGGVGTVTASGDPSLAVGDTVSGLTGIQEHAVVPAAGLIKVDPSLAPLPTYLGVLGMTGLTAYFGLFEVGDLQEGDTVVVSGAAGAVGSVVGQIAKLKGCRAVGIAGGEDKCRLVVDELGFDACIDYKAGPIGAALKEHTPDRIDLYFDNVGGEILDAALGRLARGARVVICGAISQYNATEAPRGPANYMALLVQRARMQGFLVFDYAAQYEAAITEMAGWYAAGHLAAREDVVEGGVDAFPETFARLFSGANVGKLVLKV